MSVPCVPRKLCSQKAETFNKLPLNQEYIADVRVKGNVAICFVIHLKRGSRYTCHNKQVRSVCSHQLNIEHLSWPNIGGDSERDLGWNELIIFLYTRTRKYISKWYTYVLPSRSEFFVYLPSSQRSNAAAKPTV